MKNKILFTLLLVISLFCFFPSVKAEERAKFTESSNGKLNTVIHFEEGFVGGIDVVFKIEGNVSVKDFAFNEKVADSNYVKKANYDSKNHTLTVRVTTGGVGTTHNLLNSAKELTLGTMEFTSTSKSNVEYSVGISSMKIVDNTWNSRTVVKELENSSKFIYHVKAEPSKPEDSNSNTNTNSNTNSNSHSNTNSNTNDNSHSNTDSQSNTNSSVNSNSSSNIASNSNSSNSSTQNTNSNIVSGSNSSSNSSSLESGSNSNKESNSVENKEEEKKVEEKKKTTKWPLILIGGAVVVVAAVGIAVAIQKKKN